MKALAWPVTTYGCESWTLRKNEETRLDASEIKGLRRTLRVSWTAKKTNEWVLNKAGVTMPAPHHSVFYRPGALPADQPTVSKHGRNTNKRQYK